MIRVQALSFSYPNTKAPALRNVNVEIDAGEFVLLAGVSGSGKSTLLRSMNGLIPHFSGGEISGRVVIHDKDAIKSGPSIMSEIVGFVAQNPEGHALLDTVEPEIAFALENAAIPEQEMRVRVEEVLDLLDLTSLRDRPISTLSGGERQRVAIAAVLALRPQILLLDEPTSQLDPKSAEDVLRSLVRLNEDLGLTIIIAEHRLERVLRYSDRLLFMENGRITVDGWAREALKEIPLLPPLGKVARALQWDPLPLTIKEGKRYASKLAIKRSKPSRAQAFEYLADVNEQPLLKLTGIHFAYNGKNVLNGISLEAFPGKALTIMGRNGSGKSTLLKCVMGMLQPAKGDIQFKGQNSAGRDTVDLAREIAYLPQNPSDLLFAESVREEFEITLRNHGIFLENGVDSLITNLGLGECQSAYPRDLSTGQRQRVALGCVAVTLPSLLLMDEPTRGLDTKTKDDLIAIWRNWLGQGMGLILVTHDVEMAAAISDWVVIISQGEIIASGPPVEVLRGSPLFAPQIARLFPDSDWLTADDALDELREIGFINLN
jgi:energy-coupling factor transport system ATP-binding protein